MQITVVRPFFLGAHYCEPDTTIEIDEMTGHQLVGMGKARIESDRVTRDDSAELDDAMTTEDASELVPGRRRPRVTR